jgi:hypothetical protein
LTGFDSEKIMNSDKNLNEDQGGGSVLNVQLDVDTALSKYKRRATRRDLARTSIAGVTAVCMAKGMYLAAHNNEIAWFVAFSIGSCFWVVGMWQWKEIDA